MKIELLYNPYKVETIIKRDGIELKPGSFLDKIKNSRLQEWIEDFPDDIVNELSSDDYHLTFFGTTVDYDDVIYAFEHSKKYNHIKLNFCESRVTESDKINQIKDLFEEIQNGPFEELKSENIIKAFKDSLGNEFESSVVATMSSGKSTLINALMRQDLMPSKHEACTAVITKIKDDNRSAQVIDGIQCDETGKELKKIINICLKDLEDWNAMEQTSDVKLTGNIPFVDSENTKLVLIDTPGPNNSRNKAHGQMTEKSLGKSAKNLIIYVLNATQLATADDQKNLEKISDTMKSGGKKSKDRFLFVVNKLDEYRPGRDDINGALDRVRDYLEGFGIENPNIYGLSAQNALDLRIMATDKSYEQLDEDIDDEDDLKAAIRKSIRAEDHYFEKYAPLVPSLQRIIDRKLKIAIENDDKREQALIHSGILSLEEGINLYVNKYAVPHKIKTLIDTFKGKLDELDLIKKLEVEIANDESKKKALELKIQVIKEKIDNKEQGIKEFREDKESNNLIKTAEKETIKLINDASDKLDEISKQLKDSLDNEKRFSFEEAKNIHGELIEEVEKIKINLESGVNDLLNENLEKQVVEMLDSYKKITQDLFDSNDSDFSFDPLVLSDFKDVSGNSETLRSYIEKEVSVVNTRYISNKKWYNPFSWFKSDTKIEEKETKEYIKATDIILEFIAPVITNLHESRTSIMEKVEEDQLDLDKYFTKEFEKFDQSIHENLLKIMEESNKKDLTEAELQEKIIKKEWLENTSKQVDSILSI